MTQNWSTDQPIYKQLRDRVAALIIEGSIAEGDYVPSVRQVSAQEQINHLTVAKAYQELVDEGVLRMKRGLGMMVLEGARQTLLKLEQEKFLRTEVPALKERIDNLGISARELNKTLQRLDGAAQDEDN